jgi:hypothetical protein
MSDISTCSKYIDGRSVEARIEELERELSDYEDEANEAGWEFRKEGDEWVAIGPDSDGAPGNEYRDESRDVVVLAAAEEAGARWTSLTDLEELDDLRQLRDEAQGYGGWPQCTLINEDNWIDYAQQMADDLGGVTDGWPHRHIDWEAAADELKQDYTEVRFGSASFYLRT